MPHQGGVSRASMATDFAKARVPSERASSPSQRAAASVLRRLAGLLARQAAREVIAADPAPASNRGLAE